MQTLNWLDGLNVCRDKALSYVLVTVISDRGSAPRGSGTKMVITEQDIYDTIGGGNLEFQVMRTAREMLKTKESTIIQQDYPLSVKLGQCCGGSVTILLESVIVNRQHIALFGAGHVAQKLVPILAQLPVHISWFDERDEFIYDHDLCNVEMVHTDCSHEEVKHLPENTAVLIMTHNHQVDFDIVLAAVKRPDIHFVGMIGSETKAKRFRYRLAQRDVTQSGIDKLISPVGNLDVPGKTPIEVAVSISAQMIAWCHEQTSVNYTSKESTLSHAND